MTSSLRIDLDDPVQPLCRDPAHDPEWWYEGDLEKDCGRLAERNRDNLRAKLICYGCPLLSACRAVSWDETGHVWAGLDANERWEARTSGKVAQTDHRQRVYSDARRQEVGRLFLSGQSTDKIAATMDLSEARVTYHLKALVDDARREHEENLGWENPPPPFTTPMPRRSFLRGLVGSFDSLPASA